MKPFVGDRYEVEGGPRILLVGESHYLPDGSTCHKCELDWYACDESKLSETERLWINTSGNVKYALDPACKSKAHSIWKNALKIINDFGPRYEKWQEIGHEVACCNFFLRPAQNKVSLIITNLDREMANQGLMRNIDQLKPNHVIFLSVLAYNACHPLTGPQTYRVPHPVNPWWNRKAIKYGNRNGKMLLEEIASKIKCPGWESHKRNS